MRLYGWVSDEISEDNFEIGIKTLRKNLDWTKDGIINYSEELVMSHSLLVIV